MKKIAFGLLVLLSNLSMAQENTDVNKETKFQVGVHYVGNLRNENIISDGFNGVVGISANYAVYQDDMISVFGCLNIDYLQTRDLFLQNDILIWNPNASIEINAFKGKLRPFFGLGYAFFSNDFEYEDTVAYVYRKISGIETIFLFSLEIHPIAYTAWATRVVSHHRQRYKIKMNYCFLHI